MHMKLGMWAPVSQRLVYNTWLQVLQILSRTGDIHQSSSKKWWLKITTLLSNIFISQNEKKNPSNFVGKLKTSQNQQLDLTWAEQKLQSTWPSNVFLRFFRFYLPLENAVETPK